MKQRRFNHYLYLLCIAPVTTPLALLFTVISWRQARRVGVWRFFCQMYRKLLKDWG